MLPPMELTKAERRVLMYALGRIGGKARAKVLTPARRRAIALKASKAARKARRKKILDGKDVAA